MPIKKLRPSQKSKKKDGKRNKNANTKQEQKEKENKQQNEDEDERYFLFQIIWSSANNIKYKKMHDLKNGTQNISVH